jgi:hypothetical protein
MKNIPQPLAILILTIVLIIAWELLNWTLEKIKSKWVAALSLGLSVLLVCAYANKESTFLNFNSNFNMVAVLFILYVLVKNKINKI